MVNRSTLLFLKRLLAITASGVLFVFANPAMAQIEEILVTAQKRSESLQDVPIAITAYTGDTLQTLGVTNASDLVNLTPGLSTRAQSSSNLSYFLRGVGTNDFHLTAAPAVGQYFDEVTLTSGFQAKTSLFDMERVEILKGPQNTLFGLNTTGGAVSYYSKKPEIGSGTHGSIDARGGNLSATYFEGAVGFDLGENAAARISGATNKSDGAFNSVFDGRDFGDQDTQAIRAQFLWAPSDSTHVLLQLNYAKSKNNGTVHKTLGTRDPSGSGAVCSQFSPLSVADFESNTSCISVPPPAAGDAGPGQRGTDPSFGSWEQVGMDVGEENIKTKGFSLKINHDFSWATFTTITSLDNLDFQSTNDLDGSRLGQMMAQQEDDRDTFQQEFRLVSSSDGPFRWIAGTYYLDQEAESYTGLRSNLIGGWAILPNVQLDHTKENLGVYGQVEYDFTDSLTLTTGLRWSDETIQGNYRPSRPRVVGLPNTTLFYSDDVNALVAAQNPRTAAVDANGFELARQVSQELTNEDVGFTVKLDYQYGENSLAYLSFSRGFKGSALDIRAAYALVPVGNVLRGLEESRLEPESLDAWELGYKASFLDNRVQFDAAVFKYVYENLQQFITLRGIPTLENAPESEVTGFDTNIKFANDSGFYAQTGVSYLD
jgi:iron complex outermembrane recepter protein